MGPEALDKQDVAILRILQNQGRISFAELANQVGMSTTPCWRRVQALEKAGIIKGYAALVDPRKIGIGITVFLNVRIELKRASEFELAVGLREEIVQCFVVAGSQDYLLQVMTPDMDEFDYLLRQVIFKMPGVQRIDSTFSLKTIKQGPAVPTRFAER
ncbi:MAG: Lrp/AsnC family transcriptional regulator [Blastocatellia bacterium]